MKNFSSERSSSRPVPETSGAPSTNDESNVLVIEQKRSTRELMWLVLQSEYRVQTAATYEQGGRRAHAHAFDGILLGVNRRTLRMGIATVQKLRSIETYGDVPILAVSGPSLKNERNRLLTVGFDEVLQKPFVRSELLDLLRKHFCRGRQERQRERLSSGTDSET